MTREEIIRMAREAGIAKHGLGWTCWEGQLERFAALVAAAEREACAKVCEELGGEDSRMTKHTPGPWDVAANFPHGMTSICLHDGKGWQEVGTAKTEDAAKLMAAAPDLLQMLQEIVGKSLLNGAMLKDARSVIAKATGEQA